MTGYGKRGAGAGSVQPRNAGAGRGRFSAGAPGRGTLSLAAMISLPTRFGRALLLFAAFSAARLAAQITEYPQTVAPGKVLIEVDGLRLAFDRADAAGNRYEAIGVASTYVSAGLTDSLDVQLGADLFVRETYEVFGSRDTRSGVGDLYFRLKWTFWRDDARGMALAVIPYASVPSGSSTIGSDAVTGGFIIPFSMKVAGGAATAGAMFVWDHVRNDDGNGYDANWSVSGYVMRELTGALSVYAETEFAVSSTGFSDRTGRVGVGAQLQFSEHLTFDYELLRGLDRNATDWEHVFRVYWEW